MSESSPEGADRGPSDRARSSGVVTNSLLASLGHDLRTPLNAILGYGDLLGSEIKGPLTPGQHEQVARIRSSAWKLLQLLEDILCFSGIEAGRIELSWEVVDAAEVAVEAVNEVARDARRKGLDIRVEGPEELVRLSADRSRLRQILANLLSHAVSSTDVGIVVLSFEAGPEVARFHVRDTGPGIPDHRKASIFDPLPDVGSEGPDEARTSLGVCVSRHLARLMGGEVTLESAAGQGSVFSVRIPLTRIEEGMARVETVTALSDPPGRRGR